MSPPKDPIKYKEYCSNMSKLYSGKTYEEIYGIERSKIEKEKRSVAHIGRVFTTEHRLKLSKIKIDKFKSGELVPWCKGLTKEVCPTLRGGRPKGKLRTEKEKIADQKKIGRTPWNKGTKGIMKAWNKQDLVEKTCILCGNKYYVPKYRENTTKYCSVDCLHTAPRKLGKMGYRDDLGHYVRSTWEANFARILNYWGIKYEYEKNRFHFPNRRMYIPDFRIIDPNLVEPYECYIFEVKGYPKNMEKVDMMKEYYPSVTVKLITPEIYYQLEKMYSDFVNWER